MVAVRGHLLDCLEYLTTTVLSVVLLRLQVHHLRRQLLMVNDWVALLSRELIKTVLAFSAGLHSAWLWVVTLATGWVEHALLAVVLGKHSLATVGLTRHRNTVVLHQTWVHLLRLKVLIGRCQCRLAL